MLALQARLLTHDICSACLLAMLPRGKQRVSTGVALQLYKPAAMLTVGICSVYALPVAPAAGCTSCATSDTVAP